MLEINETAPLDEEPDFTEEEEIERPCFKTFDDWTTVDGSRLRPGLWWLTTSKSDEGVVIPVNTWISSPLHAEAITSGLDGNDFGLLLRFKNPHGKWREWACPMHLLKGSGEELRGELLHMGVRIDPQKRGLLNQWAMSRYPKRRVTACSSTGWHGNGLFVMPSRNIGTGDAIFQSEHIGSNPYTEGGSIERWRTGIGTMAVGNPVLQLAICSALAGPLLHLTHRAGGGIHLVGDSSKGKTTALAVAASVWGNPDSYIRTWTATGNGLEGVASTLNDTLLCLDEIGSASPFEIGAIVYAIGNGTGKQRAGKTGYAKEVRRWRVMLLSTGERTLAAHMAEVGRTPKAGQQVRLLDIPATNGAHGAFDELHGHESGRHLADHLKDAAATCYGHIGPAFIEKIITGKQDWQALLAAMTSKFATTTAIEGRAAQTFALVATAGEAATAWGLLPWEQGDALRAAQAAYDGWRSLQGHGSNEDAQILAAVGDFLSRHGDSRFSSTTADYSAVVRDRAGWHTESEQGLTYLFTSEGLREATKGWDVKRVLDALVRAGAMPQSPATARKGQTIRINGRVVRVYPVIPEKLED